MKWKFNSCRGYFKNARLFLIINVSVWTILTFIKWSWTGLPMTLSSFAFPGQQNNKTTVSLNIYNVSTEKYYEPVKYLTSHDQDHTEKKVLKNTFLLKESDQMACDIPKLNPFDASIKKYLEDPKNPNCEEDHPLLFKTDFNSTIIQVQNPEDFGYFNCCYKEFKRLKRDFDVTESKTCIPVENLTVVPTNIEFITIYCKDLNEPTINNTVPVDMLNFIHLKPEVEQRVGDAQSEDKVEDRTVNVVILGLDAVSHMNFQRIMPKTLKYMTEQLGAIGMAGYIKPGDDTFPNVVAATTGLTIEELKQTCWNRTDIPFDSCPFIWKNYSENGYRTAYSEDSIPIVAFNSGKRGFMEPPTDYFNNAFTNRLDALLGHQKMLYGKICYGPRRAFQVSLDFIKAMRLRMGKNRRYFQFLWVTSLFHDFLNHGKLGDEPLLETLKWFREGGHLENTVFILMSDHGIRWTGIRSTVQGMIEERMPFVYFVLPQWFRKQYHSAVRNLVRNKDKLTTHFDLYETLLDLLYLDDIKKNSLTERCESLQGPELPRGISLFLPVPARRTCKDAGIEEHWCLCERSVKLKDPNDVPMMRRAAESVVREMNKMLFKFRQCAQLKLDVVLSVLVFQGENKTLNGSSAQGTLLGDERLKSEQFTCSLTFSVLPSKGTFEATVTRLFVGWKVAGDISRTNLYGSQSRCVKDYTMKKFCYCPERNIMNKH